jgi:hypothetical protein
MRECLSEGLIQKYIDKETSEQENAFIISHLADCSKCAKNVESTRQSANRIKQIIGSIDENDIETPSFKKPVARVHILHNNIKKIIFAVSAACIIIFFFFIFQKEEEKTELVFSFDVKSEFNANLPISEQDLVIQIFDSEGNIIEH